MDNIFFNAHHSPIGAFASFTLGFKGAKGGLGIEMAKPAEQEIFIGLQSSSPAYYEALPFFKRIDKSNTIDNIKQSKELWSKLPQIGYFADQDIQRDFRVATDTWTAKDLMFRIFSPVNPIPDPESASEMHLKMAILPAVLAEITVDNSQGKDPRRFFFGFERKDPYCGLRRLEDTLSNGIVGIGQGNILAIASKSEGVKTGLGLNVEEILDNELDENRSFAHGGYGLLLGDVLPKTKRTFKFAVCFFRSGIVTTGIDAAYYYTKFFKNIEAVAEFALANYDEIVRICQASDQLLDINHLSANQKFMIAHAIHSYYGSTQLLNDNNKPLWVVNEGEYRMMNTLDLTVDQLFYEMKMNPWTVRNVLDIFLERYSYEDEVRFPGEDRKYPGGISFTHDMGVANGFSRPKHSVYELCGQNGCYSYMTHEELVNWLCCATVYIHQTNDTAWLNDKLNILIACFQSMLNRDHPDPALRNGVMKLDTARAKGGTEITTYDCLDASLGQARNNIYLAGKCWAMYVALEKLFMRQGLTELGLQAGLQAERCAQTIIGHMTDDGYIPAVFEINNHSKIIPAIEGLVFAYFTGCKEALDPDGRFGSYLKALKRHLTNILVPGVCLFENGGWKLSSTSNNSWLSKIYLCQFVARKILGFDLSGTADQVHRNWLLNPELSYWCWSDQIENGLIIGSRYYPRGVTSILWLEES
jgi:hypothetical protein